jgi:HD-like signal output (HDOD) protein
VKPKAENEGSARVLFVDDEEAILDGLRSVFRSQRDRWSMRFAPGGKAALEALAEEPADVVVTDMRMPVMDGLALLKVVKERWPLAARVVLSGYADLATVAQASAVAHQYLLKPCDPEVLRDLVERSLQLQRLLADEGLREVVGGLGTLPSEPRLYRDLSIALADPEVETRRLAEIVGQDPGMSTRVLQFVNSAYFGLSRRVESIEQAIVYVGANTLRHLALTLHVQHSFGRTGEAALASVERHSVLTARIARRLVTDPARAEAAFAAGLLHDAGKLVLHDRLPEAWAEANAVSRREARPLYEVEREVLGADHAQVGAYLLGLWGIPHAILEPVAFHHQVERVGSDTFDVVAAVMVADLLAHEALPDGRPGEPAAAPPRLEAIAAGSFASWRELARGEAARLAGESKVSKGPR